MAKKSKKKRARDLTTDEAMERIFGKGAAAKLHAAVIQADAEKGRKNPKKTGDE